MGSRATSFIAAYGERGYYVLKAILDSARELVGRARLGDFDYKTVRRKLREYGLDYNPALLLSKLEREYGLIETTYKSGGQHWWRITSVDEIEGAIAEYEGRPAGRGAVEDPRVRILRIQFYTLDPTRLLSRLERLSQRRSSEAMRALREIAFRELPLVAEFLARVEELGVEDELQAEVELARRILEAAERAVGLTSRMRGSLGFEYETPRSRLGEPV